MSCAPRLPGTPRASVRARHHKLAHGAVGTSPTGLSGGRSEAQGARATSSGGYFGVVIHRTGPYPAYGGPGPVTGATTGRQGRQENPGLV